MFEGRTAIVTGAATGIGAATTRLLAERGARVLAVGLQPEELRATVERVRQAASVPVAVGFGISTADHARQVAEIADGVIVGSRVVRAAGEGGPDAVAELVAELAEALS